MRGTIFERVWWGRFSVTRGMAQTKRRRRSGQPHTVTLPSQIHCPSHEECSFVIRPVVPSTLVFE